MLGVRAPIMTSRRHAGFLIIASALLVLIHWFLARTFEQIGVASYFATAGVLQIFEAIGMPVLRGSPEGWPIPTGLGLTLSAVGWFLFYLGLLVAIYALTTRSTRTRGHAPRRKKGL
jgi:hypothetical protein